MDNTLTVGSVIPLRAPIFDRIAEASPNYGPGKMPVCRQCVEQRKQDIANKIADKVESMCLPSNVMDDELHDLLKLRRGQHNG